MAGPQRHIGFCNAGDGTRGAFSRAGHGLPIVKSGRWLNNIEAEVSSPAGAHWIALLNAGHEFVAHDRRG